MESDSETKYGAFYSKLKGETVINKTDTDDVFESIYITIISNIQKYLEKGLSWVTDSVIDYSINISKYNPLEDSSYIKLQKELDQPKIGLINIQNIDADKCFK